MGELSRAEFSDIVGAIYECAIDPAVWPPTLERICDAMSAASAALAVHDLSHVRQNFEVQVRCDPQYLTLFRDRYVTINPFVVAGNFFKVGDVISVSDVMDYDVFRKGRFFLEWAAPQGWNDNIVGVLSKSGSKLGFVGVNLRERATDDDKSAVKMFLPHITRAVAISDLLHFRAAEVARLTAAVDGLTTGVLFLSSDLKVLDINAAAERMTRDHDTIAVENGRLLLPNSEIGRKLRAAVAICAEGRLHELKTSTVVFEGRDGTPGLVAHVLPLGKPESSFGGNAAAAVFLTDPEAPVRMPIDTLIEQFGLSPSELRVLMGLMQGQTPREIADAHGIAMPTIRTHLSHLFQKTGTSRQMQLVKLATSMNSPQMPSSGAAKLS